jgi:hypothetical protein
MYRRPSSLAIPLIVTLAFLPACLTAGPGACGAADREFFGAIEQFEGMAVEAEDHPYGICGAIFTTDASAAAVVDHFAAEFEAAGWEVGAVETSDGGGEPGVISFTSVSGYRDTFQYHVNASEMEAGNTQVILMAGDSQP